MRNVTRQSSEFKTVEKILSIKVFDLSVTLVGWKTSGVKKYEDIVLHMWTRSKEIWTHSIIELRVVRFTVDFH